MSDDEDLRSLWRAQAAPEVRPPMMPAELDAKAARFARRIRFRNLREYVATVVVVAIFGALAATGSVLLVRVACVLIVVAALFVAAMLRRHGTAAPPPPPDAPTRDHLAHYRAELERQRRLLAGVPRWYLAPFLPGMLLFFAGGAADRLAHGAPLSSTLLGLAFPVAFVIAVVTLVILANLRGARTLAKEIAALDE